MHFVFAVYPEQLMSSTSYFLPLPLLPFSKTSKVPHRSNWLRPLNEVQDNVTITTKVLHFIQPCRFG
jgi:hypothetical protein